MNNTEYVALQRMVEALTARVEALESLLTRPPTLAIEGMAVAELNEALTHRRGPGRPPKSAAPPA